MFVHFPSESGLPAETPHGRSNGRIPDSVRLGFSFRDAKSRCRSELHRSGRGGSTPPSCRGLCRRPPGLQTLTVKSRLLTGENSVRVRGNPPAWDWSDGVMDYWIVEKRKTVKREHHQSITPIIHHSNPFPLP